MRELLTVSEIASLLRVSPATIRAWIRKGKFPAKPRRLGKKLLFSRAEVEKLLQGGHNDSF